MKALSALALSMFLSSAGISIVNVALPALASAFESSYAEVQWVISGYLVSIMILIVIAGRLGDRLGHKRVLLAGILTFAIGALLGSVAPALPALIAARVLQGAGAAVLMSLTLAFVSETVPKNKTGRAMGLLGAMSAIGTAAGPTLGGLLIAGPGWRSIFLIMALTSLLNFWLAYRYLPNPSGGQSAALPFMKPLFPANLTVNMLVAAVMMSTLVVGPFYLSRGLGLGAAQVGFIMSVSPLISILTAIPAGKMVDRWGAPVVLLFGLIQMVFGAMAMSSVAISYGVAGYIASSVVLSPGYQMFQAANNTTVMMHVPPGQRGAASGMLSLSRNLGLFVGVYVMGAVFTYGSGGVDLAIARADTIAAGMQITFTVAAALVGLAIIVTLKWGAKSRICTSCE